VNYLERGEQVDGWLVNFSARFIADVAKIQSEASYTGSLGEIGVHVGRLFLVLHLSAQPGEKLFAIDVFDNQHLNIDDSGRGNKARFLANVRKWGGSTHNVHLIERSSLEVSADDILMVCGRVRLFSVDGGHTAECADNDLRLAESVLQPFGVVVLDDLFNPDWPDVMTGFCRFMSHSSLQPFAITPNKVYLCKPDCSELYRTALRSAYAKELNKTSQMFGASVDVYGSHYYLAYTLKSRIRRNRLGRHVLKLRPFAGLLRD
jgi:hypothetical protein